jgi:hypothetical protein
MAVAVLRKKPPGIFRRTSNKDLRVFGWALVAAAAAAALSVRLTIGEIDRSPLFSGGLAT